MTETQQAGALTSFENREVIKSKIELRGVGGGLNEAVDFDPIELAHGEERTIVMRVRCTKVRFDEEGDTDNKELARVHVLKLVGGAAFIDDAIVREHLDAQRERVERAREEKTGIQRLGDQPDGNFESDEASVLWLHHKAGQHADGTVEGCPKCEEETALEQDGE
jgi:hypothetical protein